jgi:hypothetical protein
VVWNPQLQALHCHNSGAEMRLSHLQQICSEAGKWTSLSKPTHKTTSFQKNKKKKKTNIMKFAFAQKVSTLQSYELHWLILITASNIVHIMCPPGKGYLCTVNKSDRKLTSFTPGPCMRTFSVKTGDTYSRIPNYHQQLKWNSYSPKSLKRQKWFLLFRTSK